MSDLKIELITPFIQGTKETFETMVGLKIRRKDVYLKKGYAMYGDISGIIGLSGVTTGNCAISLPESVAVNAIETLLCEPITQGLRQPELRDGVGELINMIAGRAKAILSTTQYKFDITLPTIIAGAGHEFYQRKSAHCVVVLFETEKGGCFTLDINVVAR